MARFVKGQKGGPGRPKGRVDDRVLAARELAQNILSSPAYVTSLKVRADEGRLPPAVEQMLWHYAAGKPPEKVELTGADAGPLAVVFGGRYRADGDAA